MKILLLMILCHVIDDFVFQPICLSKLKQKDWWEKNAPDSLYKNDYKAALCMHSISWAIMIHLPLFLYVSGIALGISVLFNFLIHYIVDDAKANKKMISLQDDQSIHLMQISLTCLIFSIWPM